MDLFGHWLTSSSLIHRQSCEPLICPLSARNTDTDWPGRALHRATGPPCVLTPATMYNTGSDENTQGLGTAAHNKSLIHLLHLLPLSCLHTFSPKDKHNFTWSMYTSFCFSFILYSYIALKTHVPVTSQLLFYTVPDQRILVRTQRIPSTFLQLTMQQQRELFQPIRGAGREATAWLPTWPEQGKNHTGPSAQDLNTNLSKSKCTQE